jgi:hypothetical protein
MAAMLRPILANLLKIHQKVVGKSDESQSFNGDRWRLWRLWLHYLVGGFSPPEKY